MNLNDYSEFCVRSTRKCKVSDKKFYLIEFKNGSFKNSDIKKRQKKVL